MSLANWCLTPERAVVVSDSLGATIDGDDYIPMGLISKVWPVPHLGLLVTCWGWSGGALALWMHLSMTARYHGLRDAAMLGPAVLRQATAEHAPNRQCIEETQVIVFGHCDGRMRGVLFAGQDDYAGRWVEELDQLLPDIADPPAGDWERALAQQAYDRSRPAHDQDLIAGPLTRTDLFLVQGQPVITMRRLGVLPREELIDALRVAA